MRLIDADALYDAFERTPWFNNGDRDIAEEVVDNAPTVSPWVKTSDRLPTENDADGFGYVLAWCSCVGGMEITAREVMESPNAYPYWMPIPPLPEVTE